VINIVTKDGDPFYSGKIEYNTDHIIGTGRNSDVVKLAIGGPVIPFSSQDLKERFTFYLNGGGEWMDGRYKDLFITNPTKIIALKAEACWITYIPYMILTKIAQAF